MQGSFTRELYLFLTPIIHRGDYRITLRIIDDMINSFELYPLDRSSLKVANNTKKDFFISYTKKDEEEAIVISEILKTAGYSTIIQCADIRVGYNFVAEITNALESCEHCIAVLSPEYFESKWAKEEFDTAYCINVEVGKRFLIPVKIKKTEIRGLPRIITYIDLVNITESKQREHILLEAIEKIKPKKDSAELTTSPKQKVQTEIEIFNFTWSNYSKSENSPYHLKTFTPGDEKLFIKRNIHIDVVTKLHTKIVKDVFKLICLEGPSGCGKSSLVLSGLVPKLSKEGKWKFIYFEFAQDPYEELANGLTAISKNKSTLQDIPEETETEIQQLANALRVYPVSASWTK